MKISNISIKVDTQFNDLILDEERSLYGISNAAVKKCVFDGPADGESALKESHDIKVIDCNFKLRYPLWHVTNALIENCQMDTGCRAALWYDKNLQIRESRINGIKAVRECEFISIKNCKIQSEEFVWYSKNIEIYNSKLISEYAFLNSVNLHLESFNMKGKYSFQYVENVEIHNSNLDTKDAFWHAKNVTIYDSIVNGEYLGWYSENLKLVRCTIKGTQPFCYAKGLVLEDCTMIGCDLAFEKSDVHATVLSCIDSIKNPISGYIKAASIGEIISDNNSSCVIEFGKNEKTSIAC